MIVTPIQWESVDVVRLFGKDRAQEDENLKHYFIKTRQYKDISSGNRELVLGRKGSGKSAIFEILAEEKEKEGHIPVKISFDGRDFIYIQNFLKNNNVPDTLDDDFRYSLAWEDFIISEILKASLSSLSKNEKLDKPLKEFLQKRGRMQESTWQIFAGAMLKVLKSAKLQSINGEIEFDFSALQDVFSKEEEPVLKNLKASIQKLVKSHQFFILLDNLDEPWKNSPEMNSWLRGLIQASRKLKRDFNNLKVISFLRTDIYDVISAGSDLFDSKDAIETIIWDDNNYYNLKLLVASRIAFFLHKAPPGDMREIQEYWNVVFPENYFYGRHHQAHLVSDYLIDRTFQRPRELLQFCREIFKQGHNKKYLPVEESAISPAETEYSNWKLADIAGEFSQSYSQIDTCILSFAGVRTDWSWSCRELIQHLSELDNDKLICKRNGDSTSVMSVKDCIFVLYSIGFLRKVIRRDRMRTKYMMYSNSHTIDYRTTVFDIHPAFRKMFVQR